jgi:hypothetical protein
MIVVKRAFDKENPDSFCKLDASQACCEAPAQLDFLVCNIAGVKGNLDEFAHRECYVVQSRQNLLHIKYAQKTDICQGLENPAQGPGGVHRCGRLQI